jgi:hypothetical protein
MNQMIRLSPAAEFSGISGGKFWSGVGNTALEDGVGEIGD